MSDINAEKMVKNTIDSLKDRYNIAQQNEKDNRWSQTLQGPGKIKSKLAS